MLYDEIIKYVEDWAPPGAAWEKDNVGLQIGSRKKKIKNILLSLDLNQKVLQYALSKDCNFILTHHPLLFRSLKKINPNKDDKSKLITDLIKNDITVFSAHTNFDFTKDGVSFELAKVLKLQKIDFLMNQDSNQFKVIIFSPPESADKISNSLFEAGGGIIGEYKKCSYRLDGTGTFEGSEKTKPAVGKKENFEKVDEIRIEVIVDSWKLSKVIEAIHYSHPYEEPAYDIYPLKNKNVNFGMGAIGDLEKSMSHNEFIEHTVKNLKAESLRFAKGTGKKIKKVAVCGGSGVELLNTAISCGADAFVTADIKYHTFQDAEEKILLIDAGHYETEIHSLNVMKRKLDKFISSQNENIKVFKYSGTTNPIKFYKQ